MLKGYQLTCTCRWPAQARFPLLALQSATFHEGHLNLFARPWEPRFLRSCWNGSLAMLIPSGPYDRGWGSGLPSLSAWVSAKDPGGPWTQGLVGLFWDTCVLHVGHREPLKRSRCLANKPKNAWKILGSPSPQRFDQFSQEAFEPNISYQGLQNSELFF